MEKNLQRFLTDIVDLNDIEELKSLFQSVIHSLGFINWAYQTHETDASKQPTIHADYPSEWVSFYEQQEFHRIDPIVAMPPAFKPYMWSEILDKIELCPTQKKFFRDAHDYGLHQGLALPVPDLETKGLSSTFTFIPSEINCETKARKLCQARMKELHAITILFHKTAAKLAKKDQLMNGYNLTEIEKECLYWFARGKSQKAVAQILEDKVSERMARVHFASCIEKLGVSTSTEASVKAASLGLIEYGIQ